MNEYIQILNNSETTSKERSVAINGLIQIKNEIECHVKNLSDSNNNEKSNINIDNVNKVMFDIKDNLDNITFDNLCDIKKLFKMKNQITKCNDVLATTKPVISIKNGEDMKDITDEIKDKFVIATSISDENNNIVIDA